MLKVNLERTSARVYFWIQEVKTGEMQVVDGKGSSVVERVMRGLQV